MFTSPIPGISILFIMFGSVSIGPIHQTEVIYRYLFIYIENQLNSCSTHLYQHLMHLVTQKFSAEYVILLVQHAANLIGIDF